ncbi:hypothetical protein [Actinokineospora iranica]|uniref:Uncharacterized protein n=1 Tax=Actinokineospora iranica TaxID=1271860 RepID=A0A1G6U2L3_9PSEU|nr:hypothetical protein [Actinokineospora iranica]SDD35578.1 hypothetical protein SAMN05216174_11074 [Actinokineospora iranica]
MEFDRRVAWPQVPAINKINKARAAMAHERGWEFAEEAPALLQRWPVLPFTDRGDMRLAYGALSGTNDGLAFTVFEFIRRPTVIATKAMGMTVNKQHRFSTDSVWVVRLPAPMPYFQITSRDQVYFDLPSSPRPTTADRKFNRRYRLVDTDPSLAAQVLTPQIVALSLEARLGTWSLLGSELVYAENTMLGMTSPAKVLETLAKLAALISCLPFHLGGGQPPVAYPPQQLPAGPPESGYVFVPAADSSGGFPPQQLPAGPPESGYVFVPAADSSGGFPPQQPSTGPPQSGYVFVPAADPRAGFPPRQPQAGAPWPEQGYPQQSAQVSGPRPDHPPRHPGPPAHQPDHAPRQVPSAQPGPPPQWPGYPPPGQQWGYPPPQPGYPPPRQPGYPPPAQQQGYPAGHQQGYPAGQQPYQQSGPPVAPQPGHPPAQPYGQAPQPHQWGPPPPPGQPTPPDHLGYPTSDR